MSYEQALGTVKRFWDEEAANLGSKSGLHWFDNPKVEERINFKVTGRENYDRYQYFIFEDLQGPLPVDRALTLGCGTGLAERGLAEFNFCRRHDGLDVSEGAIRQARDLARREGLHHIHYEIADLNNAQLPENEYDVVFGISSVHHIVELEALYENVHRTLRPGGIFYMDEFVGPSQFQWPDRQVDAINSILGEIPVRFRRSRSDAGTIRERHTRPTVVEMNAGDPSEAIRSAEIIPLLSSYFTDITIRPYGGTILLSLLEDIAGNFEGSDPEAMQWLERIFAYEDNLIDSGELSDDYAVIIARKGHSGGF